MDRDVDLVDVEKFHQETSDVKCFRCSSVDGIQFGHSTEAGECNCSFDVSHKGVSASAGRLLLVVEVLLQAPLLNN